MAFDLYFFDSRDYGTTFTARPEIIEKAQKECGKDYDLHFNRCLLRGEYEYYSFPIVFRQFEGSRLRDFLNTGDPPVYLVSNRVLSLLRENRITGWERYPIILFDKKNNLIDGYSGFSVLGQGGSFAKWREYRYDKKKEELYVKERGVYDISQWDGSDFFLIDSFLIVTARVVHVMKANKVTALSFQKFSDDTDIIGVPRFPL